MAAKEDLVHQNINGPYRAVAQKNFSAGSCKHEAGVFKPLAYSWIWNPCGILTWAQSCRTTTSGAFEFGREKRSGWA